MQLVNAEQLFPKPYIAVHIPHVFVDSLDKAAVYLGRDFVTVKRRFERA